MLITYGAGYTPMPWKVELTDKKTGKRLEAFYGSVTEYLAFNDESFEVKITNK